MFIKTIVIALCVVGAFADQEPPDAELVDMVEKVCKHYGAESKVNEVVTAVQSYATCVKGILDAEFGGKPLNFTEETIKLFCTKRAQFKECIHGVIDGGKPCLDQNYLEITASKNGSDQIVDFVCKMDDENLLLLDDVSDCYKTKWTNITECVTKVKDSANAVDGDKALTIVEKCTKYDEINTCIVDTLKDCAITKTASMTDSLFKTYRKGTPCDTALPPN